MMNVTMNMEKNGIEIRFDNKPEADILDALKAYGFRWSSRQKMWYAKQTDSRIEFINTINGGENVTMDKKVNRNNADFNLWEMTRTDDIEDHYKNERIRDGKEIAKRVRKHLRARFPMCKWSVTSDYNSVEVRLKSAPWDKDSEMVKAIVEYAYQYTHSYNYNDSDYMSDYHDVNFYGTYKKDIAGWDYQQREETVKEMKIREAFEQEAEAFRIAEEERQHQEYEAYQAEQAAREARWAEQERRREEQKNRIQKNIKIEDVDGYFVTNLWESLSKLSMVSEYMNLDPNEFERTRTNAKVTRNVYMSKEDYDMFSSMLLDDFDFLEHMGGSETDDNRINDYEDFNRMSAEERKTVKWYSTNCVAVYVDGKLMLVADPQGYSYVRYCFFPDAETVIGDEYKTEQIMSDEEKESNREIAERIEEASADIIIEGEMFQTYLGEENAKYRGLMRHWIKESGIKFDIEVVREITIPTLKTEMLNLLADMRSIRSQFKDAGFKEGDKFTLIKFNDFGMMGATHGTFKFYEEDRYAQHDNAVRLVFRPERKRRDYQTWLYNECLIYRGWVDCPQDVLWKTENKGDGVITSMTLFASCDRKQYDAVADYLREHGIEPVIDTTKPIF